MGKGYATWAAIENKDFGAAMPTAETDRIKNPIGIVMVVCAITAGAYLEQKRWMETIIANKHTMPR